MELANCVRSARQWRICAFEIIKAGVKHYIPSEEKKKEVK